MEEEIIQPVDKELLKSELISDRLLRVTNKSHNEIYVISADEAPHVMDEIGRLREIAFRSAGGGTGKAKDIDEFDLMPGCCKQLIVWNPEAEEIIGGYRYVFGADWQLDGDGQPMLATSHMFHFSDKFMLPIPLNWAVLSCRSNTRMPVGTARVSLRLTTFGTVLEL